ncbi:hypothetical protein VNO77_24228 [Canavalia gladiata]|uniref:Uncharacterized protein n=1 Tax=Canavalia gladiata TaxID=3824 RepID=A0AAN9L968_CANGL
MNGTPKFLIKASTIQPIAYIWTFIASLLVLDILGSSKEIKRCMGKNLGIGSGKFHTGEDKVFLIFYTIQHSVLHHSRGLTENSMYLVLEP